MAMTKEEVYELKRKVEELERRRSLSGMAKWFPDGPLSIDKYPKHKLFFDLGDTNRERVFMAANRCLAEGTLVATPVGPKAIETLKVGDYVYDRYGEPTYVHAVYDNGYRHTVSMQNRGKEYLRCTPDHLMDTVTVDPHTFAWDSSTNTESSKVAAEYGKRDLARRQYVESPLGSVSFGAAYALGAFIGDGCCTCGNRNTLVISSADSLVPAKVASLLDAPAPVKAKGSYNWSIKSSGEQMQPYYDTWCRGKLCHEKSVDLEAIKEWDRETSLNFVAGLLDTDGSLTHGPDGSSLCFHNQSETAIEAFCYLVLALWQEPASVRVDKRAKYKNGPVLSAVIRNPHAIARVCKELSGYVVHKYKVDASRIKVSGKRSRPEAIKLSQKPGKYERVWDIAVDHPENFFLLANGISVHNCGKTTAGAYEVACHATGKYPTWWKGRRFEKPIEIWVAGKDKTTTRDTMQVGLLGPLGAPGTGMIPAEDIERTWSMQGVPNGVEIARIKHVSGGFTTIGFKSYDRGVESFFGTARDVIWLDEECPEDVYGECLLRTMTTGGIMITTFTPKKGLTPLVLSLSRKSRFVESERFIEMEEGIDNPSRVVVMAGWDDVPHLDAEAKKQILEGTPAMLRDAVAKGIPTFGEGNVYPLGRTDIECDPFEIPKHYRRWYGMDVGWNCTAAVFFAQDPDSGQIWITDAYKGERSEPIIHAAAIKTKSKGWMAGAVDPGARQRNQQDGTQLMQIYRDLGLQIIPANNNVESGVGAVWELLSTGKLKVFKSLPSWFAEFMTYIYENGRIKKTNDHLMDATRYGIMTKDRIAQVEPTTKTAAGASHGRRFDF